MVSYLSYYFRHWSTTKHFLEKLSWVSRCTRYGKPTWPLTLNFGPLTWISIGIKLSLGTIYVPNCKLLRRSILELCVSQGVRDQHDLWPWTNNLYITRDEYGIKDYIHITFEASGANRNGSSILLGYLLHNARVYGHADTHTYRPTHQPTDKHVQSNIPFLIRKRV